MPDLVSQSANISAIWRELGQRFRHPELVGRGTCADVYSAFDTLYNRKVALKIAKVCEPLAGRFTSRGAEHSDAELVGEDHRKRTRMEGELLRHFSHANIIECYEVLECLEERSGQPYVVLVLELADLGELYNYLSTMSTLLNQTEARYLFKQTVDAVAYCHERAVVHRDLKLENILLSRVGRGPGPTVKLSDFGLAERFDPSGNRLLATYCGSLLYASPELMQNKPYRGPEVDCWALGVILFSLVCGRMPFRTVDPAATAHLANLSASEHAALTSKIVGAEYELPDNVRRDRVLTDLICGLLNPEPSQRYNCAQIVSHSWMTGGIGSMRNSPFTSAAHESAVSSQSRNARSPAFGQLQWNSAAAANSLHQPAGGATPKSFIQSQSPLFGTAAPSAAINTQAELAPRPGTSLATQLLGTGDSWRRPATSRPAERRKTTAGFDERTQRELDALLGIDIPDGQQRRTRRSVATFAVSAVDLATMGDRSNGVGSFAARHDAHIAAKSASNFAANSTANARRSANVRLGEEEDQNVPSSAYGTIPRSRRQRDVNGSMQLNARTAALLSNEADRITELINGLAPSSDSIRVTADDRAPAQGLLISAIDALDSEQRTASIDRVSLSEMLPLSITAFRQRFGMATVRDDDSNKLHQAMQSDSDDDSDLRPTSDGRLTPKIVQSFALEPKDGNRADVAELSGANSSLKPVQRPSSVSAAHARASLLASIDANVEAKSQPTLAPAPMNYSSAEASGVTPAFITGELSANGFTHGQPAFAYLPPSFADSGKLQRSNSPDVMPTARMTAWPQYAIPATHLNPSSRLADGTPPAAMRTHEAALYGGLALPGPQPHMARWPSVNAPGAHFVPVSIGEEIAASVKPNQFVTEPRWKQSDASQSSRLAVADRNVPQPDTSVMWASRASRTPTPGRLAYPVSAFSKPVVQAQPASAATSRLAQQSAFMARSSLGVNNLRPQAPVRGPTPTLSNLPNGWPHGPVMTPYAPPSNHSHLSAYSAPVAVSAGANKQPQATLTGSAFRQPRASAARRTPHGSRFAPPNNAQSMHSVARTTRSTRPALELELNLRRNAPASSGYPRSTRAPAPHGSELTQEFLMNGKEDLKLRQPMVPMTSGNAGNSVMQPSVPHASYVGLEYGGAHSASDDEDDLVFGARFVMRQHR